MLPPALIENAKRDLSANAQETFPFVHFVEGAGPRLNDLQIMVVGLKVADPKVLPISMGRNPAARGMYNNCSTMVPLDLKAFVDSLSPEASTIWQDPVVFSDSQVDQSCPRQMTKGSHRVLRGQRPAKRKALSQGGEAEQKQE
jgi:hypothetical protein